jgi:hypothetical protein
MLDTGLALDLVRLGSMKWMFGSCGVLGFTVRGIQHNKVIAGGRSRLLPKPEPTFLLK